MHARKSTGTSIVRFPRMFLALACGAGVGLGVPAPAGAAASYDPRGRVEVLEVSNGAIHVHGWAIDPDYGGAVTIVVREGDRVAAKATANLPRPDVAGAYPAWGPNHGFDFRFRLTNGDHDVCITALNHGRGFTGYLACQWVRVNNNPRGKLRDVAMAPGGVRVAGWALDPNTRRPATVRVWVDGRVVKSVTADVDRTDIDSVYSYYGTNHGFDTIVPVVDGDHKICAEVLNVDLGDKNVTFGCRMLRTTHSPVGGVTVARAGPISTTVNTSGWSLDPDVSGAINVQWRVDDTQVPVATVTADRNAPGVASIYPNYGALHGLDGQFRANSYEHRICATGVNVQTGVNKVIGCAVIPSTGDSTPSPPPDTQAWPGNAFVDVTWTAARSTQKPVTGYTVVATPGGTVVKVGGSAVKARISGLHNGTKYTFTVTATNELGTGSPSTATATPSNIPPQFTPAPVSTSHYPRNWTGNATNDAAMLRKMGATDASYNPSGHKYLVLMDIGGQDESRGGVLLSATSKYFSYAYAVTMMKAYIDGYHSAQKQYAPLVLAVGTNNDVDVSRTAGANWANKVIDPLVAYTSARYGGITIAGAQDIEPGFSATKTESRDWVDGYLANTTAIYVFNGSADGCSTTTPGGYCNNGWTMADLQYVGGGAAPSRTINLPQIYNSAMPLQWKYISLTGVNAKKPRLYFGGPLTEWTACDQAASCFSITNVDAWGQLWRAISSHPATRQYDLPYGTDLQIN